MLHQAALDGGREREAAGERDGAAGARRERRPVAVAQAGRAQRGGERRDGLERGDLGAQLGAAGGEVVAALGGEYLRGRRGERGGQQED